MHATVSAAGALYRGGASSCLPELRACWTFPEDQQHRRSPMRAAIKVGTRARSRCMRQLHISGISAAGRELKLARARIAAGPDAR
jgi:hypothetical protein